MKPVTSNNVSIADPYWEQYRELIRNTVIPYQWEALNDRVPGAEPSFAVRNFKIAAGLEEGEFGGMVFQDSDLYKWLEAAAYSLAAHPDPLLERIADEAIDLIGAAQMEDGYINTYYTVREPGKRWTNLFECHELYCAGHFIEAAVAYYQATGKRKVLDIACRFADYIDTVFGTEEGKIHGYDGHQEIELSLVKLYETTGNDKYLALSRYFIDERGREPHFFVQEWEARGRTNHWPNNEGYPNTKYNQSHIPVRKQRVAVGHSVRAVYMYTAMADLAARTNDADLAEACRALWNNMTTRQMYITGAIGSTRHGEAFTFDYDLPNDTAYAETCASIGLIFFAQRMLQLEADSKYADVMERALYNTVVGSMSLDGKHYFYVNPLEVWPEACSGNPGKKHVKPVRQKWFGCSCCPPNVARLLSSLDKYIYSSAEDTIYAHLFIGSSAEFEVSSGKVRLVQESKLPWEGLVSFEVETEAAGVQFELALRVPSWCGGKARLRINGVEASYEVRGGYAVILRLWSAGDRVEWEMDMPVRLIEAHPQIRADAGKAAIVRGPIVYFIEEADNGAPISSLSIASVPNFSERYEPEQLGGVVAVEAEGWKVSDEGWGDDADPYRPYRTVTEPVRLKALPYAVWGNRGVGEMSVWIRVKE